MQRTATSIKNLLKIKTQDLIGPALNWAVAQCEGVSTKILGSKPPFLMAVFSGASLDYCTKWAQGGPIIEREKICPCPSDHPVGERWNAIDYSGHVTAFGPTPLIAAMRCYVASKLGDTVDIPEELQ